MQLTEAFKTRVIEEEAFLSYATQLYGTAATFQGARHLDELALGAARFQAINHEKDGTGETGRKRWTQPLGGRILRGSDGGLVLLSRIHPRFPATLVTR